MDPIHAHKGYYCMILYLWYYIYIVYTFKKIKNIFKPYIEGLTKEKRRMEKKNEALWLIELMTSNMQH